MTQAPGTTPTLKIKTLPAFKPLLLPARYKAAHGGRGGAKSHFFAELLVDKCYDRKELRAVCIREMQYSLKRQASRSAIMRLSPAPALPSPAPGACESLTDQHLPGSGVADMEAPQRTAVAVLAVGRDGEVV